MMRDDDLPTVVMSGEVEFAPGLRLTVHNLSNGQRVIDATDMQRFMAWLEGQHVDVTPA